MTNRFLIVCGGTGYKMLGQRTTLGVDAELQIDVTREIVSRNWKVKDPRSLFVELDQRVGTTAIAFKKLLDGFEEKDSKDSNPDYAHAKLLNDQFPANRNLEWGLNQSPAVAKAAIMHPFNKQMLGEKIKQMVTNYGNDIGPENPVEVWIISSTAGGTGEGIHRHVANVLAEHVYSTRADTPVTINFIRVGPLTYRSVNDHKTSLNTFLGIAADAAFMLQIQKTFPHAVTNWFYLDLPDVGKGDRAKSIRGEIVEIACKSILLPELQIDFQKLLVNNNGAPIVVVRSGYWGKDFNQDQKYYETLDQLIGKLKELIGPNYSKVYIENKTEPAFVAPELDERIPFVQNANYVLDHIEKKGWQFPAYNFTGIPKSPAAVIQFIHDWEIAIKDLLEIDLEHITVSFNIDETIQVEGGTQHQSVDLRIPNFSDGNEKWFQNLYATHRVRAWAMQLLGIDFKDRSIKSGGYIVDLLGRASDLSKIFHGFDPFAGSESRAKRASAALGQFARRVVQVGYLIELEQSATRALERELGEAQEVLNRAMKEFDIVKPSIGAAPATMVRAAELSDTLDQLSRKTWIQLLVDSAYRGDFTQFKEDVMRGATGLTESGLRSVLDLPLTASILDIQNTLATKVGRIIDDKGEDREGAWWQATEPASTLQFEYRILPNVTRELQAQLKGKADERNIEYRYIFTKLGTLGLHVLAFLGDSLNQGDGDTVSAPAFLLQPLVNHIKDALANWSASPEVNTMSGQLDIATAGVVGEPLFKRAMSAAGLTNEEIKKIGQYYSLYN